MADQFREAEATFSLLREKFKEKRISPQEFPDTLKQAMELGGKDEGAPGPRGTEAFYAAYFRDLDGKKLDVFFYG